MVWKVLLSLSLSALTSCEGILSSEEFLRRVESSWCGLYSPGIGYSYGEYFVCSKRGLHVQEDLRSVTLRIGIIQGDDFEYDCSSIMKNGKLIPKDSYSAFILSMLQEVLRFEPKFVSSTSWGYYEDSNHSWRGLTGSLAANITDMAACHWTTTEHLFGIADFLVPTMETTQSFVYLPGNLPLRGDVFVEALSRKLWTFFLLCIFLLAISFWFSTYVHSRVRPDHEPWTWDEVALWAIAAVSQQSYSRHPRGSSCRTMFLIGYMITYLLYTGFAASITSLLALKSQQNQLTLDDVAQMKLHLLLLQEEYNLDFFEKSNLKFAYLDLKNGGEESLNEFFHKIKQKNFLGFGSTIALLYYLRKKINAADRESYAVVLAPDLVRTKAFLVQKTFPYRRLFNYWLLRMRESGLLDLGRRRYLTPENTMNLKGSSWFSAGLENVASAMVFLVVGWILSACVLVGEIVREKRKRRAEDIVELIWIQQMAEDHPNVLHGPKIPVEIPKMSLGQFIFARLKSFNPYDALMFEAETGRLITPKEFLHLSARVAEALKTLGFRPGDVVTIIGRAKIDVYATATGVLFQGGTVSPLDHSLPTDQFLVILKTISPRFVFCDREITDTVSPILSQIDSINCVIQYNAEESEATSDWLSFESFVQLEINFQKFRPVGTDYSAESLAFLVCSSGTMGTPKPVKITNRNLLYQATVWGIITAFNKFFRCPAISFSYFFWISGVLVYLMIVCIDFEMTIVQKLESKHVLEVIEKQKPVWGMFSPALVKYLTWQPDFKNYNVTSLMLMITGGTSLSKVVVDKVKELWSPQISCRQSYGVTELTGSATASSLGDDVLSVGRLLPGFHMKIVSLIDGSILGAGEEGEIYLKSPSLMKGYLGNDWATAEVLRNGWYKTGDMGKYNEKGLVYITGRVKDFIKREGVMVSPLEVEEVILSIAGVADAGVVGVGVNDDNHLLVALVTKLPNAKITQEDILNSVHESLPEPKRLWKVLFVDFIPRTPSGKMKRSDLLNKAKALLAEE